MLVESLNGVNPNAASATSLAPDMGAIGKIKEFFQEQRDSELKKNNFIVFNSSESLFYSDGFIYLDIRKLA